MRGAPEAQDADGSVNGNQPHVRGGRAAPVPLTPHAGQVHHQDDQAHEQLEGPVVGAVKIADKNIEDVKVLLNGAGAAGMACIQNMNVYGVKKENTIV